LSAYSDVYNHDIQPKSQLRFIDMQDFRQVTLIIMHFHLMPLYVSRNI